MTKPLALVYVNEDGDVEVYIERTQKTYKAKLNGKPITLSIAPKVFHSVKVCVTHPPAAKSDEDDDIPPQ